MTYARRQFNATLLPGGEVLVTGGTRSAGFSDRSGAVHAAEIWDPETGKWRVLASNQVTRVYHSTTLLLPDGRILHTGSGDGPGLPREVNAEIFSPPYLFRGSRPTIAAAPPVVGYGEKLFRGHARCRPGSAGNPGAAILGDPRFRSGPALCRAAGSENCGGCYPCGS